MEQLYINALRLVRPDNETYRAVGREVVRILKESGEPAEPILGISIGTEVTIRVVSS